jgi:hypothetical protein
LTKESIIDQTYYPKNFPFLLFAYPRTGKRYQREERRDQVLIETYQS